MPVSLLAVLPQRSTGDRLVVNPRWAERLSECGLTRFADFIDLPGEILSGHADRHVVKVELPGPDAILKREHRKGWRARIRNRFVGSLSRREALTLDGLRRAGVPVPEWIAYGEAADGRAFLLLRRLRGYVDLRKALARPGVERRQLCENLGRAIGRLHRAGYVAPDLSAKHVLVKPKSGRVVLIDWPRARHSTSQRARLRDLARLNASVTVASITDRMRVLRAWRTASRAASAPGVNDFQTTGRLRRPARLKANASRLAKAILTLAPRERVKYPEPARPSQRLRWLDDERLCVARPLWRAFSGRMPIWLIAASRRASAVTRFSSVRIGRLDSGWLTQLPPASPSSRIWAMLSGRPVPALAVKQAALAFMLERRGVPITPVLAFGGRDDGSGFLLVQAPEEHRGLREYLGLPRPRRSALISRLGAIARTCHEAGVSVIPADRLIVDCSIRPRLRLVIDGSLQRQKRLSRRQNAACLQSLARDLGLLHRGDIVRLLRGYVGERTLRSADLQLASQLLRLEAA